jgi:hypothetical protein
MLSIGTMECPFSKRCWANRDLWLAYLKSLKMFRKPCSERSFCLPYIFHLAIWTRELIYAAAVKLILFGGGSL